MKTKTILTLLTVFFVSFSFSQQQLQTSVAGMTVGMKISAQKIIKGGKIEVSDTTLHIKKFYMSFKKEGKLIQLLSPSNEITNEMKEAIHILKAGQELYFESIEGTDKSGKMIKIPAVYLIIE